ncbi:MAG TPA: methyltransferase [Woeseiaceae bacterium]|nr:methyltransferase [Woeseiaceae bacterium]
MMDKASEAYRLIWVVRRLFRALAQASDKSLQDIGVSAADRAVLEFLHPDQALSVPQIAERYRVSRQHVQATVNNLIGLGYLAREANRRHKRSSLIAMMPSGKAIFRKIAICPTAATASLVTNGVYSLTRNPMYLGMLIMLAGAAVFMGTLPFYAATAVLFVVLDRGFCRYEEAKLAGVFGQPYRDYKGKVRRWI